MINPSITYSQDGKAWVLTQHETHSTIAPLENQRIIHTRKTPSGNKCTQGIVVRANSKEVVLKLHHSPPASDEILITTMDGPWELTSGMNLDEIIEATLLPNRPRVAIINPGIRCERTRKSVHPQTLASIILQCVKETGHTGACHYENPSNKRKQ